MWTLKTTKELPITEEEKQEIKASPIGLKSTFTDIWAAVKDMPLTMRQMIPMMFFTWYAMFIYWIYIAKTLARSVYGGAEVGSAGFRDADILSGQIGAFYNFIAFLSAFGLAWLARKYSAKYLHAICLSFAGVGLFVLPSINNPAYVFIPMIGMGLSWASMMGNPYVILAGSIPPKKAGVYMGIFNMFIVIPMLLQNVTMPLYYESWLNNNPINAMKLAGVMLLLGAVSTLFIRIKKVEKIMLP